MARLGDWRRGKGWTQQQLADAIPCDLSTVARYEAGTRDPDKAIKERIFILTNGEVEPNDFYDVPRWRRLLATAVHKLTGRAA